MPVLEIYGIEQFRDIVNSKLPTVIVFSAVWCVPCKSIAKELEKMSYEFADIRFAKVDVDNNQDIAAKCNVAALPTFMFVREGEQLGFHLGGDLKQLTKKLKDTFKS